VATEDPLRQLEERREKASGGPVETESETSGWEVQVAARKDAAAAEQLARRLGKQGYKAFVRPPGPGDIWHRVRIGGVESLAAAKALKRGLAAEGFPDAWCTPSLRRSAAHAGTN
jgi:cell division septation protein DedD